MIVVVVVVASSFRGFLVFSHFLKGTSVLLEKREGLPGLMHGNRTAADEGSTSLTPRRHE